MENLLSTANNANRTSVETKKNGQTHMGGDDSSSKITTIVTNEPEQQLLNKQNIRLNDDPPQQQTTTLLYDDHGPSSYPKNHYNNTGCNGINNNNNYEETVVSTSSISLPPQQLQLQKSPELILGVGELTNPGSNTSITSISTSNPVSNNNNNHIINNPDYSTNHVSKNINSNNNSKWMGSKRNVSFPEDSSIVTGFSEPCNPWKNAPICTAEELVVAYKKGCELNGVKPWNKIIQQLLSVQNCWDRHKTLNLKGEKLDQKHCESLEDIFRRVQFENLELEACHLDDETAAALFDMIEYYDSTMKLNISFNKNIGMRGWQSCSRMIRKTPSLSHLDARGCELNGHIIPILGRSLKMGSNLTVLHLEYTYLSGRPLVILVAALKVNEILQELFLGDNKLMASDGIQIGTLLRFNHKLQLLDLRNNHFQDVGLSHICEGFCEKLNRSGLSTLVLWNNQISYQGMPSLSRALSVVECLETLNLGHNSITNEGIHYLKEGLLKNKSLIRLGLQGTKVLCEGAVALAEYIADSARLLRIDLRENDIRTAGLMALSLALKVNESLVRLELDRNTKKEVAVKDYAEQQRRLLQDINTYLERNQNLAIKRETEEKEREKHKAEEAAKTKEEEEEGEGEEEDLECVYIPTCTRIRRPTLLFPGEPSPQHTLDSPAFIPDDEIINQLNSQFSSVSPMSITTPPPPGEFLLSPQYCENTKAKKIFTVTKVGDIAFQRSPTSGSLPTSSPGLMSSASSMDQIMLSFGTDQTSSATLYSSPLSGPSEIRKEIAAETVCGLFGILSESEATHTCQMSDARCQMPDYKFQNNNNKNDDNSIDEEKSVNEDPKQPDQQLDNVNIENVELEKEMNKDASLKQETFLSPEQEASNICKQPILCLSNDSSQVTNTCDDIKSVESTVESVTENATRDKNPKAVKNNMFIECVNNRNVDNCKKDVDNVVPSQISSEIGAESEEDLYLASESLFTKCDKEHNDYDEPVAMDDEMSSNSDLLTNHNDCLLQRTPVCQVDKLGEKRPEFHTNLSLNGMTQELANVLDSLELEANCKPEILSHTFKTIQTDTVTSPAEYEKELDDMLAHVQQGYNVKS